MTSPPPLLRIGEGFSVPLAGQRLAIPDGLAQAGSFRMLIAALMSRWMQRPQGQVCCRSESFFLTMVPQPEHSWEVYLGSTKTISLSPFQSLGLQNASEDTPGGVGDDLAR